MSELFGIWGRPYIDLSPCIDIACFPALDEEIAYGLARVETSCTGGSLKWMNVVAPWVQDDPYVDYGHVIRELSREEFSRFISLAEDPAAYDVERHRDYTFGDETDNPLTRAQMRYLAYRYNVYFPWKVCYHLLENDRWEDKHSGEGKDFSEESRSRSIRGATSGSFCATKTERAIPRSRRLSTGSTTWITTASSPPRSFGTPSASMASFSRRS
jgi:hypothetical protein